MKQTRLLTLAGGLLIFSKIYKLTDLPAYDHADPGPSFSRLDHIIRELMETVISTRYISIPLSLVKPSYYQGRLDSEKITENSAFYLAVSSASMPASELVDAVPKRLKLGAPDDVNQMVLSAMPGIGLISVPQVPAAIAVKPNHYYFSVVSKGQLFERMMQARSISVYVPSVIAEVQFELLAVNLS